MTADLVFVATMPSLRLLADRCRHLALIVRCDAVREQLLALAEEMEQQAEVNDRTAEAETDR